MQRQFVKYYNRMLFTCAKCIKTFPYQKFNLYFSRIYRPWLAMCTFRRAAADDATASRAASAALSPNHEHIRAVRHGGRARRGVPYGVATAVHARMGSVR